MASWGELDEFRLPTYPPGDPPKWAQVGFQEPSYVKMPETPKLDDSSKDGPHFWVPRGPQNQSKIDKKSILRYFYVDVVF